MCKLALEKNGKTDNNKTVLKLNTGISVLNANKY